MSLPGYRFFSVVVLSVIFFFFSCASSGPVVTETITSSEENDTSSETPVVSLYVPENTDRGFLTFDNETILQDLEMGTPESLQNAANKMRKSAMDYTQSERIALTIASSIMTMVWPSEKNNIEIPPGEIQDNPYTAAIDSARVGIYDLNTGRSDFFTNLLPALVILSSFPNPDYFPLAQESITEALAINKNSALGQYLLGVLYLKMQQPYKGFPFLDSASKNAPNCFEIQYAKAEAYYLQKDYISAFSIVSKLLASKPRNLMLLKLATEIALAQEQYTVAEQYIAQVLQQEPDNAQYLLYRIKVLVEQENYIKAVPLLDVYARTDKTAKDYLLLRAHIQHHWNKNAAAASATLEEALMLYPDDFDIILSAAELASSSGMTVKGKTAGQLAEEILEVEPENTKALEICMNNAIENKNWQEAYELCSSLMKMTEGNISLISIYINICLQLEKLEEAEKIANSLYSNYPESDDVKEIYIRVLAKRGKKQEVLSLIKNFLPTASSKLKSFLYYQRSVFASSSADRLSDLRQSLTSNPRNKEPLFELYKYYFDNGDYRKAQYYLKQVVALNPSDQEILQLNAELDTFLNK